MVRVKHFLDTQDHDDGKRLWVEPLGLTKDLQEMCHVDVVLNELGPPVKLAKWFERHPDDYDRFRAAYHGWLAHGPFRRALQGLARASAHESFTLLHQGDSPNENTASALAEFISELEAYNGQDDSAIESAADEQEDNGVDDLELLDTGEEAGADSSDDEGSGETGLDETGPEDSRA